MSIAIPAVLKKQLVDDHDAVKNKNVVPLPKRPCVNDILQQYVDQASRTKGGGTVDEEQQVANGLRAYFDRCLFMVCSPVKLFSKLIFFLCVWIP